MTRVALLAVAVLALLWPTSAAARSTGSLTITISPRAEQSLSARGVTLSTTGKATRKGRRVNSRCPRWTPSRCARPERCACARTSAP